MRKLLIFGLSILFLTSLGLFKPTSVLAVENGPAGKAMLRAVSGARAGTVTLSWNDVDSADNYHLVYGTDSKNMKYGVLNLGRVKSFTVGMLSPGTKYYFALVPVVNNVALYTSEWVSSWVSGGAVAEMKPVTPVTSVAPVTSIKPVTTPVTPVSSVTAAPAAGPVGKHWLQAKPGPQEGEVTLYWRHADDANNYHLVYGTENGKFKYGQLNIGWVNSFTVKKLVPGVTYYFALVPVKNDVALYTTDQVMTAAKMNVQIVQTTPEALMMPKVFVPAQPPPGIMGGTGTIPTTVPTDQYAAPTTPSGN